jgi:hypothetical protein
MSAFSVSVCELTETYSPAAIDNAPATNPARVAKIIGSTNPHTVARATLGALLTLKTMKAYNNNHNIPSLYNKLEDKN